LLVDLQRHIRTSTIGLYEVFKCSTWQFRSDAYSDADAREEMIELENDSIDTRVNGSQDASTEGIGNGSWNHDD
jgi:hypothetical protein